MPQINFHWQSIDDRVVFLDWKF